MNQRSSLPLSIRNFTPTVQVSASPEAAEYISCTHAHPFISLTGNAKDVDGNIVSYQWQQVDGPSVKLDHYDSPKVTFNSTYANAAFTFRLTVTDNDGASTSGDVSAAVKTVPGVC